MYMYIKVEQSVGWLAGVFVFVCLFDLLLPSWVVDRLLGSSYLAALVRLLRSVPRLALLDMLGVWVRSGQYWLLAIGS